MPSDRPTRSVIGFTAAVAVSVFDHTSVGLEQESAVNCDGLHTIAQSALTIHVGNVDDDTMVQVCSATSYALGC